MNRAAAFAAGAIAGLLFAAAAFAGALIGAAIHRAEQEPAARPMTNEQRVVAGLDAIGAYYRNGELWLCSASGATWKDQ